VPSVITGQIDVLPAQGRNVPPQQLSLVFGEPHVELCDDLIGWSFPGEVLQMKKLPFFSIVLVLLMAGSAVSQDVRYNFDSTADFSKFKTYKWITLKSEAPIDKLTDDQIKASLDAGLARKGLKKVDTDNADLFIGYQTTEHISEKFASFSPGWTVGPGWAAGGLSSGGTAGGKSSEIYKGELAVDMYNPANQHLIWRGVASKSLDPKAQPEKRQKNLDKAVSKLMKDFPPPNK
jgi:hypothetical protein